MTGSASVARPGDDDLDCILHGLRISPSPIITTGDSDAGFTLEARIAFDASQATGWWIDAEGERVWPDRVMRVEVMFGIHLAAGYEYLAAEVMQVLSAWAKDAAPVTMTAAPGKWTLLSCPGHPAGTGVVIPRSSIGSGARERP